MLRVHAMLLGFVLSASAMASAQQTQAIGGVLIKLPEPPGLVSLKNPSSPYYKFNQGMQSQTKNRLVGVYLPAAAAKRADSGQTHDADDWAIAFALGPDEGREVTREVFQQKFVPIVEAALDKAFTDPGFRKKIDTALDKNMKGAKEDYRIEGNLELRMGVVSPLGLYAKTANYITYGAGTKIHVTVDGKTQEMPLIMVLGTIVVKDRLLGFAVYRKLNTREDIDRAKKRTVAWAERIAKANP